MHDNKWVPQVLKDVEKYCHENDLSEVAFYLEEARLKFRLLQDEKRLALICENENVEPLKLVWSRPEKQVKVGCGQV